MKNLETVIAQIRKICKQLDEIDICLKMQDEGNDNNQHSSIREEYEAAYLRKERELVMLLNKIRA